jgi:IS5 family transposase
MEVVVTAAAAGTADGAESATRVVSYGVRHPAGAGGDTAREADHAARSSMSAGTSSPKEISAEVRHNVQEA